VIAEAVQKMSSWKQGFTIKCFRPLVHAGVWHPFDLRVPFHQALKSNLRR